MKFGINLGLWETAQLSEKQVNSEKWKVSVNVSLGVGGGGGRGEFVWYLLHNLVMTSAQISENWPKIAISSRHWQPL